MQKPEPVIKVISEILKSEDPYIMAHRERMICSVSFVKQSCKMDEVKTILNIGAGEWGPFNRLWAAVFPNAQITLSEGDLRDMLPYSSESFDFVICTEVFEHIAERDLRDGQANFTGILNLLSEIGRLLKRGGGGVLSHHAQYLLLQQSVLYAAWLIAIYVPAALPRIYALRNRKGA